MLIFSKKSPCRGANMAILGAHWQAQAGDAVARGRLRSWLTQVFFKAHAIYPRAHVAAPPEAAHAPPQVDGHLLEEVGRLVGILREHAAHGVCRGAVLGDEPLKFFLAFFWSRIFAIVLFSNAALFLRRAPGPFCYTRGAVFFAAPFAEAARAAPRTAMHHACGHGCAAACKTCLTGSPNGLRRSMKRPVLRYNGAFSGENATAAPRPSGCAATPPRLFFLPPQCIFLPRAGIMSAICIIFA